MIRFQVSKSLKWLKGFLSLGAVYNLFIYFVGRFGFSKLLLSAKYVPYTPGLKILDLGCGPGTNSTLFQPSDYLGIDISEKYINSARKANPAYKFESFNFLELSSDFNEKFDIIIMAGLIHHLSDEQVNIFLRKAYNLLKNSGHLITIDNCLHDKQSVIKRKIILLDRGQNVRHVNQLLKFADTSQFKFTAYIEEDLLLIPYTHFILTCKKN